MARGVTQDHVRAWCPFASIFEDGRARIECCEGKESAIFEFTRGDGADVEMKKERYCIEHYEFLGLE
jgi:hypothetical protein